MSDLSKFFHHSILYSKFLLFVKFTVLQRSKILYPHNMMLLPQYFIDVMAFSGYPFSLKYNGSNDKTLSFQFHKTAGDVFKIKFFVHLQTATWLFMLLLYNGHLPSE